MQCYFYFAFVFWWFHITKEKGLSLILYLISLMHPVYDGYVVGGIPPTLFLVFISNDNREKKTMMTYQREDTHHLLHL